MIISRLAKLAVLLVLISLLCTSCQQTPTLSSGIWRAVVQLPGGELPFGLDIHQTENGYRAYLVNGNERVAVDSVGRDGVTFVFSLSTFNSRIKADLDDKQLKGNLTLTKRGGKKQHMPFHAVPGESFRFFDTHAASGIVVDGRWAVTFLDDQETKTPAIGEFKQVGKRVTGTFLTETGDYRFLEGEVRDSVLYLSCFDGAHAFLFVARLQPDGSLNGDFWSGTAWRESWTAERDHDAKLRDPFEMTYLKNQEEPLSFTFPDVSGKPVSLSDKRFENKVVWIMIGGSWCPNCHDEARFMGEFYKRNRNHGLEMIGLMYEHLEGFDQAVIQINRYAAKYDLQYPLLFAGSSDKKKASETLPMLNGIMSYPTLIMLDKDHQVRYIHTGFSGPGTGEHYERLIVHLEKLADQLLSEISADQ